MAETLAQVAMRILPHEMEGVSPERLAEIEKAIADQSPAIIAAARTHRVTLAANSPDDARREALKSALEFRRKLTRAL
jgi:hypothetical protein